MSAPPFYPGFSKNSKTVVLKQSMSSQMDRLGRRDGSLSAEDPFGSATAVLVLASGSTAILVLASGSTAILVLAPDKQ